MKRGWLGAVGVAALGAVGFWWLSMPGPVGEPVPPRPERVRMVEPSRPMPVETVEPILQPPGYDRMAEALGGVAIHCPVEGLKTPLYGGEVPRYEAGTFSTVVPRLRGELLVGTVGAPAAVRVRWEAANIGDSVVCEAEALGVAELAVEVIDARGSAGVRMQVEGCGASGTTGVDGRVTLEVPAQEGRCWLSTASQSPPYLGGEAPVDALEAGESRDVVLYVDPHRKDWWPSHAELPFQGMDAAQLAGRAEQLRVLARQGDDDAEALAERYEKRAELARVTEEQDALLDEMHALTRAHKDGDPEALRDLEDLSHDLMDNARRRVELLEQTE